MTEVAEAPTTDANVWTIGVRAVVCWLLYLPAVVLVAVSAGFSWLTISDPIYTDAHIRIAAMKGALAAALILLIALVFVASALTIVTTGADDKAIASVAGGLVAATLTTIVFGAESLAAPAPGGSASLGGGAWTAIAGVLTLAAVAGVRLIPVRSAS